MERMSLLLLGCCAAASVAAQPVDAQTYRIDIARSDIHWQVYKAGAFARLGHNHVISVGEGEGEVVVAADLAESTFELSVPVNGLVVDDPALRAGKGEDFASEPSEDDIAGTKQNMLSETVLNGEQFPVVRVSGSNLTGLGEGATLDLTFDLLGGSVTHTVPTHVTVEGDVLTATGEFSLQHEDLGMKPFSVMMGALQVGPQIDFIYHVHAVAIARN
jgi:polyisoprenoid-binding protein YceI